MALNKKRVAQYIAQKLESEKPYYPSDLLEGVSFEIYYQSFGSCGVKLMGQYGEQTTEGLYRYKDLDIAIFKFVSNSHHRYLETYYRNTKKNPLGRGFEFLSKLYKEKAQYNCSYWELKSNEKSNLLIFFIGTNDFLITCPYWGVVALGVRSYDYDNNRATYKVQPIGEHIARSRLAKLCQTYESKRLKGATLTPIIEMIGE